MAGSAVNLDDALRVSLLLMMIFASRLHLFPELAGGIRRPPLQHQAVHDGLAPLKNVKGSRLDFPIAVPGLS